MDKRLQFKNLDEVAKKLRADLVNNKFILLYAYNSVGKTRLSTAFKNRSKTVNALGETGKRDTLYFNAFTEDLFLWDNDLENDRERKLKLNADSVFFKGLETMEMDNRIRPLLDRFVDFGFRIDTTAWEAIFDRMHRGDTISDDEESANAVQSDEEPSHEYAIKVSRSEENVFIWCFFLAIVQLALDDDGRGPYSWVKYIYIDDPVSSLDEHNAIAVANHLVSLLNRPESQLKTIISTHHPLFFNVLCNELKNASRKMYFLTRDESPDEIFLRDTGSIPFFHHVAVLAELCAAERDDRLRTHHFGMLRAVMEKTASFHGHKNFSACFESDDDEEGGLLARLTNVLSHGNHTLFEPQEMPEEKKRDFRKILDKFIDRYPFNQDCLHGNKRPK